MSLAVTKTEKIDLTNKGLLTKTNSNFKSIMTTMIGANSIYESALTKIEQIIIGDKKIKSSEFTSEERAKLIANIAANMVPTLTGQALETAFTIAKEDRDKEYDYMQVLADTQLRDTQAEAALQNANTESAKTANVEKEGNVLDAQVAQINHGNLEKQAIIRRMYGFGVTADNWATYAGSKTSLTMKDEGLKYEEILATKAQGYKALSSAYREAGGIEVVHSAKNHYKYTFTPEIETRDANNVNYLNAGLIAQQTRTQHRQYDSFDDNMATHAVNSSSTMLSTLLSEPNINEEQVSAALSNWGGAFEHLLPDGATYTAIPTSSS